MYTRESSAIQICVRNKLEKIRLKDYEESSIFFTEFEKLINELKGADSTVTEKEKLNYMLRTLPDSLNYIGDLIDAVKESDQTCEFLKNKIAMWEAREKGDNSQNQNRKSTFKTEQKDSEKTCFGCGKPGNIKANCRNTWSKENSRRNSASGGAYGHGSAHQSYRRRGGSTRDRGSYQRGNNAAKGTDAMIPITKAWAHFVLK